MSFYFETTLGEVAAAKLARMFRVLPPLPPSDWASRELIVPDGPKKLERWDITLTPYIAEPLNMASIASPVNEVAVMKSAQTGFTMMLLAAIGYSIDREPCDMMVVQPTDGALTDFSSKKLGPMLEHTPALARKVKPQASRSGAGSTAYEKKFGADTLTLSIATSSADLRSKTIKKMFLDEADEYPDDLDGQGDPVLMAEARQESFLDSGEWKRFMVSTPTVKGESRIENRFYAGDQRRWHVPCPDCGHEFYFAYGPNFHFQTEHPYGAFYETPCCHTVIEGVQKKSLVRRGRWIATAPGPGKHPSYHFDALSSPFVPWDVIAKRIVEAGDDPAKLKGVWNLTLGLPYEIRGDAPDHERLMGLREDYPRGRIPPLGLLLVASAERHFTSGDGHVPRVGHQRQDGARLRGDVRHRPGRRLQGHAVCVDHAGRRAGAYSRRPHRHRA